MSTPIIKVENISKQFIIAHEAQERYTSLRDVISRRAKKIFSFPKQLNANHQQSNTSETFWALKDVSFDINAGDRLGIIGRNGAGKSTLLKILSRITEPSKGRISIRGRVASLLEVGTGFHPELTGRENIYLNGAILGMSRNEIKKKFDEIVAFAEVERFLDTPVKRYSSGMYVRLAFAVAAHLEPEILIVDEVLAVGDAQFQKKCLGKMEDVSKNQGRTVLFVSHNLPTIKSLCTSIVYLKNGQVLMQGGVEESIAEYLNENRALYDTGIIPSDFVRKYKTGEAFFTKITTIDLNDKPTMEFAFGEEFFVELEIEVHRKIENCLINIHISSLSGESIALMSHCDNGIYQPRSFEKGKHVVRVLVQAKFLPLQYNISASIAQYENGTPVDFVENIYSFKVSSIAQKINGDYPWGVIHGYIEPQSEWSYSQVKMETLTN